MPPPQRAVSPAIKTIARVLDWTGEAMGAAFTLPNKVGGQVIDGAKAPPQPASPITTPTGAQLMTTAPKGRRKKAAREDPDGLCDPGRGRGD